MDSVQIIIRLLLSTVFGGMIGIERESANRPAGFRTHILVCLGSTLIMLVSLFMFELFKSKTALDPSRIAAQVISGIGFLGAGTIIREGATVRGLTTAASLWTVAAIGLAVGCGFYAAACLTAFLTIITLITFSKIEEHIVKKRFSHEVSMIIKDNPGQIGRIGTVLGEMNVNITSIKMESNKNHELILSLDLRAPSKIDINDILINLSSVEGVLKVEFDEIKYVNNSD